MVAQDTISRGDVRWANLPTPADSGAGHRRPVVIVQAKAFNRSRIRTVVIVAVTSNVRLAEAPGNVLIRPSETGLPKDSVANVSQIYTLDRDFLSERAGRLSPRTLAAIDAGLRVVLDL